MLTVFLERERRFDDEFFLRRLEETDGCCLVSTSSILSLDEDLQRILWVVLRRTIRFWCGPVPSVVSKSVEYDVPGRLAADTNVESEVEAEADADAGVDGDERLFDESLLPGSDTLRTSFPFFLNMSRICVNWVSFGSILSGACNDLGNLFARD